MKRLNRFKKILFWQTRETAAMSHISKLETMQDKILRTTVNAPWYVRNEDVRKWRARDTEEEKIEMKFVVVSRREKLYSILRRRATLFVGVARLRRHPV